MKKLLLTLVTLAASASFASAETATFAFTAKAEANENAYGLTISDDYSTSLSASENGVTIDMTCGGSGSFGYRLYGSSNPKGLAIRPTKTGTAELKITAGGKSITNIVITMEMKNFSSVKFNGTPISDPSSGTYSWQGDAETVNVSLTPPSFALASYVYTINSITVTYADGGDTPVDPGVDLKLPEDLTISSDDAKSITASKLSFDKDYGQYNLNCRVEAQPGAETVSVTIAIPEGWTDIYYTPLSGAQGVDPFGNATPQFAKADYTWYTQEMFAASDFKLEKGNTIAFPAKAEQWPLTFFLAYGDDICAESWCNFNVSVIATPSGVDSIGAAPEDPEYFTLQGVRVANPEKGIYVKLSNGRPQKVVLK